MSVGTLIEAQAIEHGLVNGFTSIGVESDIAWKLLR